ncbi:MAG TPA: GNAT family N-acetyltransferase [Sediminibacterium sp.]|nr:GNAT family N-acetyltransferase [Sediminibacterium sp.]
MTKIYHRPFDALSPAELYAMLRLRSEVFVVEQNCVYPDLDNKDIACHHLFIWDHEVLVAGARLLPPGLSFPEISIGRVVSAPAERRKGWGKVLMRSAIKACGELFGEGPIRIGAQLYLQAFYEGFGFEVIGDTYLEDNIPHIGMIRRL